MGRRRDAEDMPRLLAALGLGGPGGFDRSRVDETMLSERERAALEHWVPTRQSLHRAAEPTARAGPLPQAGWSPHAPVSGPSEHDEGAWSGARRERPSSRDGGDEGPSGSRPAPGHLPSRAREGERSRAQKWDLSPARAGEPSPAWQGEPSRPREENPSPPGRHRPVLRSGPVVEVPAGLRGARRRVSWRVVAAGAVVVVLVTLVLLARVVQARAEATPRPVVPVGTSPPTGAPGASSAPSGVVSRTTDAFGAATSPVSGSPTLQTGTGAGAATNGPLVVVHVVGQVRRPGLVRLPAGSRVADAVRAAGGASPRADLSAVNLARVLVDGEQIQVPKPGEVVTPPPGIPTSGGGGTGAGSTGGLVNLNTADLAALDSLPGVGPVLAQRILDWRTEHGRFSSVDELGEVSGIGEKILAQLTPKVTL